MKEKEESDCIMQLFQVCAGGHWSIVSGVPLDLILLIHLWNHCVKYFKYRTNVSDDAIIMQETFA